LVMTVTRIRNTTLWFTGCALTFAVSIVLAGYIGFSKSMRVMTAPAPGALVASVVPLPPPVHDPHKPTVAVLFWFKRAVDTKRRIELELRVPPVALAVIAAALMWCARLATPDFDFPSPSNLMFSVGLALVGALICLAGVVAFRRAKTTVNPMKPDTTSSLVVSGIYRYTRNPMYLGFLLLLMAWAAALSNVLALVSLPAFVLYMNCFQIVPEERMLASRFEQDFAEYRARVRRWL
jgi:protein-S-isoprenylcysteine O-methyltransferase Ste14